MTNNFYKELTKSLMTASIAAINVSMEDGGASNFDSLLLCVKGGCKEKMIYAIRNASLDCEVETINGSRVYLINPPVSEYQGNARTRMIIRMRDVMNALGYNTSVFYCLD